MTVNISSVPYKSASTGSNEAETLVTERFELAESLAVEQVDAAQVYLDSLKTLFANAVMPSTDINYDFQEIVLDSPLESQRPEAPSDADLTPEDVAKPVMEVLNTVTIPTITIPEYTLIAPANELVYNEGVYQSDLQDALKIALKSYVEDGGTGLSSTVEDAMWARARARQDLIKERIYNEAEEFIASKGYTIPPGALNRLVSEALTEQTRADAQLNYEITIEQARLARAQSEYTITAAINLEGQDKDQFNNIANRALDYAKSAVEVIFRLFDTKVKAYLGQIEGAKIAAEAEKVKVEAVVMANSGIIDAYKADVEAYKVQVQSELGIVELIAKVYGFKIAGYEADAKVAATLLDAQIKEYQGRIEQANNQTTLTIKEAELVIQSYLGALGLTSTAIQAGGNVSAQIAASALSAVNASASLGASKTTGFSVGYDYNYSLGNSATLSETHKYDETAT